VTEIAVAIAGDLPGAVTNIADLVLTLRSPKAFPPGQPLEFVLTQSGVRLQARSIGSKRLPESDAFELRVRLINLRRETREALAAAWAAAASGE
jgi:hypothetical protein